MAGRQNVLLAVAAALIFLGLIGGVPDRLSGLSDAWWWAVVPWLIILAAWAFIGTTLWRRWRNSGAARP